METMVSLQPTLSQNRRNAIPEYENFSRKRKLEGVQIDHGFEKRSKGGSTESVADIELQLETPLPLEWQRCLDIKSGQIHFYNTRTHKRTSKDPRRSPERPSPDDQMSLDLQLNLPCESLRKSHADDNFTKPSSGKPATGSGDRLLESSREKKSSGAVKQEGDRQEMIATVCTRCHMLVMLCKSSPACPNCKFMNSPEQGPPALFKRRCTLLC